MNPNKGLLSALQKSYLLTEDEWLGTVVQSTNEPPTPTPLLPDLKINKSPDVVLHKYYWGFSKKMIFFFHNEI